MAPRSSGPGGEFRSPPGRTKPPAHSKINTLTETEVGESRGATVLGQLAVAQLQAAWVSFGKQRRVTSGERRSIRGDPKDSVGDACPFKLQKMGVFTERPYRSAVPGLKAIHETRGGHDEVFSKLFPEK